MRKILFSSIILLLFLCSCNTEAFLIKKYTRYVHSLNCPPKKKCDQSAGPSFIKCINCETADLQDSSATILTAAADGTFAVPSHNSHIGGHSKLQMAEPPSPADIKKVVPQPAVFGKALTKSQLSQTSNEKQKGIFKFLNTIFKIVLFVVILAVICAVIVLVILVA